MNEQEKKDREESAEHMAKALSLLPTHMLRDIAEEVPEAMGAIASGAEEQLRMRELAEDVYRTIREL
jgi:hypothetical protein